MANRNARCSTQQESQGATFATQDQPGRKEKKETGIMKKEPTTMFTRASLTMSINTLFNHSKRRSMKNNIFTFAVMGFMAGTLLMGCGKTSEQKVETAKEDVKDAKQELKAAQTEYLAEWQTFKREAEQTIAANEKRIDAFKEKMEKAGPKFRAKYSKEVAVLEQKNLDLKKKLEEYKDGGQSNWEEFKTNFKHDMDAMGKTMEDLFTDKK